MSHAMVISRLSLVYIVTLVCNSHMLEDELLIACDTTAHHCNCTTDTANATTMICIAGLCQTNNFRNISALVLCSNSDRYFNPHDLYKYTNLYSFTLFRSAVEHFIADFGAVPPLQILNMTYNNISYLHRSLFQNLDSLVVLDLRFNKLRSFDPEFASTLQNIKNIFLFGNQWNCSENFSWILENNPISSLVTDAEQLVCKSAFKDKPVKQIMLMIHTLELECREISDQCVCSLDHVIRVGNSLRPMIIVDCSNKGLRKLPSNLPNFTSTLIMSGNQISDLSPLRNNEKYLSLLNIYLDYNNITSIAILEDSPLLFTFQALSLLGNQLKEVPTYVLEQAFEKNPNIGKVTLGQNPWNCDCGFTPVFRDFLAKYRTVIKDIDNVTCSYRQKDDKSLLPILSLSRNKLCHEPYKFRISALNVLNVCMTILLAVILMNFAYNYYMYKRYGKLPWIANKLP